MVGKREWTESLDTTDESVARTRWKVVHERVKQVFREAEAGVKSPAVVGYKAVQAWREERATTPSSDEEEEALDSHITTLLARDNLDATRRAVLEALLNRQQGDDADNPPLSVLFSRYYAERKLPAKTKLEWGGVLKRFTTTCGDLPARAITQANVRSFKVVLLSTTGRTGETLSPATVKK